MTLDATDASFENDVLVRSDSVPVVVDLWAPWCGPCKTLSPIIERVVEATAGAVELVKVNVDKNPMISQSFGVQSIPAVFAIKQRRVVDQFVGALGEAAVRAFVDRLLPVASEADELIALGDEASLRRALEIEPDRPEAVVALAEILVGSPVPLRTRSACWRRFPTPGKQRRVAALARLAIAGTHVPPEGPSGAGDAQLEEHMGALLDRVKTDDGARQELVDLLETMDPSDPRREQYGGPSPLGCSDPAEPWSRGVPPAHSSVWWPRQPVLLELGRRRYDLTTRALIVGILNRTPDSFYNHGAYFSLDRFFEHADNFVQEGADLLDVGGVKAGPGQEVTEEEELDRVLPVITSLRERFDVPLSVGTWRASVAAATFEAGAVVGNDISGFADPDYLPAAAAAGASVVATHVRLSPRVPDPSPHYNDVVAEAERFLLEHVERALLSGIPADHIVLDAGLDLGKTADQSLLLLQSSARLASLGYPLLLSSSNKTFLGVLLGLEIGERANASLASTALGIAGGCRLLRVHDVAGTRKVRDLLAAILESAPERHTARGQAGPGESNKTTFGSGSLR